MIAKYSCPSRKIVELFAVLCRNLLNHRQCKPDGLYVNFFFRYHNHPDNTHETDFKMLKKKIVQNTNPGLQGSDIMKPHQQSFPQLEPFLPPYSP